MCKSFGFDKNTCIKFVPSSENDSHLFFTYIRRRYVCGMMHVRFRVLGLISIASATGPKEPVRRIKEDDGYTALQHDTCLFCLSCGGCRSLDPTAPSFKAVPMDDL